MRLIILWHESSTFLFWPTLLFLRNATGWPVLPCNVCKHCPVLISQILTVESAFPETRMLSLSSIPLVNDWCPVNVWMQFPVSTSQTRIDVSRDPLTTWMPSNYNRHSLLDYKCRHSWYYLLTLILKREGSKAWETDNARNKMRYQDKLHATKQLSSACSQKLLSEMWIFYEQWLQTRCKNNF